MIVPHGATTCGAKAHAVVRIDVAEHERRAQCGLGALNRLTINAMFSLPYGHPIRWADIDPMTAKFLRRLPEGIVECSEYGVCRLVVPPVTVDLAVVTGLPWRSGLRAAGAFAPFCRRVLLLDQRRRIPESKLWEADYWGIGVWVDRGSCIAELVSPAPWRQVYAKPAGWAFRERAYDAWLGYTGRRPLGGPPDLLGLSGITSALATAVPGALALLAATIATREASGDV